MIRQAMASLLLLGAVPAPADQPATDESREVRIPRMASFLEWVADGDRGVFVRGDTGKWYYARTQSPCPRLRPDVALSFVAPGGELDRHGALRVEGWRCPLDSVTETEAPPGHEDH